MELPSDVIINGSVAQGVIYYFKESSFDSDEPHYFVVLNRNASDDNYLYLVNATSKIKKASLRIENQKLSQETLVIVSPQECPCLTLNSAFDCNSITKKHYKELISLVDRKALELKGTMPKEHLAKLINAAKKSTLVENRIKKKI